MVWSFSTFEKCQLRKDTREQNFASTFWMRSHFLASWNRTYCYFLLIFSVKCSFRTGNQWEGLRTWTVPRKTLAKLVEKNRWHQKYSGENAFDHLSNPLSHSKNGNELMFHHGLFGAGSHGYPEDKSQKPWKVFKRKSFAGGLWSLTKSDFVCKRTAKDGGQKPLPFWTMDLCKWHKPLCPARVFSCSATSIGLEFLSVGYQ